ncbi:MAG TPA: nitroreductase family protein [Spirochaetota bacterium]|nr:nitroreductase family protein [Spirochaetota bacterium]
MKTIEAIKTRRSINFFDKTMTMSREEINTLVELASLSPSSFNLQPWEVIAVHDPQRKKILKECAFNQPKVEEASVVFIIIANPGAIEQNIDTILSKRVEAGTLKQEDVGSTRPGPFKQYGDKDSLTRKVFAVKNASLFAMTLMLAAKGLGLESHPMDGFSSDKVKKEFGIPDEMIIPMLVAVGYPAPDLKLFPRAYRRSAAEILRYDRFS